MFGIDGRDYIETAIAENVSRFRVERVVDRGNGYVVDISLDVIGVETGDAISLQSRVRVGGAQ